MRKPGRDIATGVEADAQIDAFISRRHEQRLKGELERELEAAWMASERVQQACRMRENAAGWYSWHVHRAELYAWLSAEHVAMAEGLMEENHERRIV